MHLRRPAPFGLLLLVACGTAGGAGDASFRPVEAQVLPAAGKEAARVLLHEVTVRFEPGPEGPVAIQTSRRQAQILGAAGQGETEVGTSYSATFERVEQFAARVTDAQGRTLRTWGRNDAVDAPAFPDFVLYSDSRVLVADLPDQPAGNIVESVVVSRMTRPELFAFGHGFGEDIPVHGSRFVVEVPAGFEIEHVGTLGGGTIDAPPRVEASGGLTRYVWERTSLPAFAREPHAPHWASLREGISVRLASWTDAAGAKQTAPADARALSRYTYAITGDRARVTPELAGMVKKILEGVADEPRAKARRLYAWTRDSIRYCAVSVGMGGWVPHSSVEVEKVRYGDCKDKANLLKSMLKVAGIESRLVTIYAGLWPEPFRLPVLAGNFNHAILLVDLPEGPAWVDPTTRTTPFDDLPPVDEDRFALPISEGGDPLVATLPSLPERERVATTLRLTLDGSGVARGDLELETNGAFADSLRQGLLEHTPAEHDRVVAGLLPLEHAQLSGLTFENPAPPEEVTPAVVRGRIEAKLLGAARPGADVLFSSRSLWAAEVPVVRAGRTAPLLLGWRQTRVARAAVELPAGASVSGVPEPVVIDTPHLRYALAWHSEGARLTVERELVFKVRAVPPAELGAWAEAAERVARAEEQKLVIKLPG